MPEQSLHVLPDGRLRYVHDDSIAEACRALGETVVRRASFVEPDEHRPGTWLVDLSPVGGPLVVDFPTRLDALHWEQGWLQDRIVEIEFERDMKERTRAVVRWVTWLSPAAIVAALLWMKSH